jgi:hypothetical protein
MEIHTLYWKNTDPIFVDYHKSIMRKFSVKVNYTCQNLDHGLWMDKIVNNSNSEVIGFIDIDCIITNSDIIKKCEEFVLKKKTIIGIAQTANHIFPATHIHIGAGFFFINKYTWEKIGKPSFDKFRLSLFNLFKKRYDYAEGVCYKFEEKRYICKAFYPSYYQIKKWPLHNYGNYGIGTYYNEGIYHLYESRYNKNKILFQNKCEQILQDKFTTSDMIKAKDI